MKSRGPSPARALGLAVLCAAGCEQIIGFADYEVPEDTGKASASTGGPGGAGGLGGAASSSAGMGGGAAGGPGSSTAASGWGGGGSGSGAGGSGAGGSGAGGSGAGGSGAGGSGAGGSGAGGSGAGGSGPVGCAWVKGFGSSGDQFGARIATDGSGQVLLSGLFAGSLDLGAGTLTAQGTELYVAKLSSSGSALWSRNLGGNGTLLARGIAADSAGNAVLAGSFGNTLALAAGGPVSSLGGSDVFVAKLDTAGVTLWSRAMGGALEQKAERVAVDAWDDVLITGSFEGVLDFGGGTSLTSAGGYDVFVAKYDAEGSLAWVKGFGDVSHQFGEDIAVDDAGNVVVTGQFQGEIDFGGGALASAGGDDVFVAKLTPLGEEIWSSRFGDAGEQAAEGLAVDGAGNVAIIGDLSGSVAFEDPSSPIECSSPCFYVARLDSNGQPTWAKALGDAKHHSRPGIAVDGAGELLITGRTNGLLDPGNGPLASSGGYDVFFARLDASGLPLQALRLGDAADQYNGAIAAGGDGSALLSASFGGTLALCGEELTSAGGFDVLVAKVSR